MTAPTADLSLPRTVTGAELNAAVAAGCLERLFPASVAVSPDEALERLRRRTGEAPRRDGTNVAGIQQVRDVLHAIDPSPEIAAALVISAPHTHWDPERPILLGRRGGAYSVVARRPGAEELLTPVSFVFTAEGLTPYEWAEADAAPDAGDLARVLTVAARLNAALPDFDWPLGIALNCRFKPLLALQTVETVELPGEDDTALIMPRHLYDGADDAPGVIQVAWHAHADQAYGLDPDGVALLRDLRTWLDREAAVLSS